MKKIEEYHNYVLSCVGESYKKELLPQIYRDSSEQLINKAYGFHKHQNDCVGYYNQIRKIILGMNTDTSDQLDYKMIEDLVIKPEEFFKIKQRKDKLNKLL